jgi:hypothetical protein
MRRKRPTLKQVDAMVAGSWTDLRAAVHSLMRYAPDNERKEWLDKLLDRTMFGPPEFEPTEDSAS